MIDEKQFRNIVSVTGANEVNDKPEPISTTGGPWDPWSSKVMILAGIVDQGPWLWLACRDCGWFLGYASQHGALELAENAQAHMDVCEVQP